MKATPVMAVAFGLLKVSVIKDDCPLPMLAGLKALLTVGLARTVTTSVASLLVLLVSPPPDTVAVLLTLGAAGAETATVNVIGLALVAPALITPALVQVTVCPVALHAHPVPLAETYAKPVGKASVTVIVPLLAALPAALLTVKVKLALVPTANVPAWVLVSCKSATLDAASKALVAAALEPPLVVVNAPAAMVLVRLPAVVEVTCTVI